MIASPSHQEYFVDNKYLRWYLAIVSQSDGGRCVERHHIIPRSIGGGDEGNIVRLSYRKHFLVHWLLTKCTSGKLKRNMCFAMQRMVQSSYKTAARVTSSWQYAVARRHLRIAMLGNKLSIGHRNMLGKKLSDETKNKLRLSSTGRRHTAEARAKISAAMKGNKRGAGKARPPRSQEFREKHSQRLKGKPGIKRSEETKAKMRVAALRREALKRSLNDCVA